MVDRSEQRDRAEGQLVGHRSSAGSGGLPASFGEAVFALRTRLGLSQAAVSCAAKVASGYFSEIENGRRVAPPRATAMRIAIALQLRADQVHQLVALADAERAASTHDAHLAPDVRQLLAEIRTAAPELRREAVEYLRARVREVSM